MLQSNRAGEWTLRQQLDLVKRAYLLRKARRICIVFLESGRVYLSESEENPWGSKRLVSWDLFQAYIEAIEAGELQRQGQMATDGMLRETGRPITGLVNKKDVHRETVALTTSEPHTRAVS